MDHYPGVDNNLNSTAILPQGAVVPPLTYTPRTQCIGAPGFVSLNSLTFIIHIYIYIYTLKQDVTQAIGTIYHEGNGG